MPIKFSETGLQTNTLAEIRSELKSSYRSKYGASFNLDDESDLGKEIGVIAEAFSKLHESFSGIYNSNARSKASGISLDYELERIGLTRNVATASISTVYARGTNGQSISAEALNVSVIETSATFKNLSAATLGIIGATSAVSLTQNSGTATITMTSNPYADDSFVFLRGASLDGYNILGQVKNGTSTTFELTVDSTLASPAVGTITVYEASPVILTAINTGATTALSGTLTNIVGTVPGIVEVENLLDATLGVEKETDSEARSRADSSVSVAGGGFREAILAKLNDISGVIKKTVFENNGNSTDGGGRPSGSVECFVEGGTDGEVATAVFNSVSSGVRSFGSTTVALVDSEGESVSISFSRLSVVELYVDVEITINSDVLQGQAYPSDGDAQIAAALAVIHFSPGYDVWSSTLEKAINSINGVVSIDVLKFAKTASPTNTNTITITPVESANIDSGNVSVTST